MSVLTVPGQCHLGPQSVLGLLDFVGPAILLSSCYLLTSVHTSLFIKAHGARTVAFKPIILVLSLTCGKAGGW